MVLQMEKQHPKIRVPLGWPRSKGSTFQRIWQWFGLVRGLRIRFRRLVSKQTFDLQGFFVVDGAGSFFDSTRMDAMI